MTALLVAVTIIVCCFSLVFERYKSYSPYDMLESIKKEVKGDLENAFLNLGKQVHTHTHTPRPRHCPILVDISFQSTVLKQRSNK